MAKVTIDSITQEQIDRLTPEQEQELTDKGEIEMDEATPETQPPPTGEGEQTPPPGETGEQKKDEVTPPKPTVEELLKQIDDEKKENDRLRRESDGRLRDLIDIRQKHKEPKPPDTPPVDPFAEVLKVGEEDFIDGRTLRSFAKKVQDYIGTKEQDFNAAVEQRVSEIYTQQRTATIEASRKKAEAAHPDYADTVKPFFESLSPAEAALINQELAKSQDPAEECYKTAKRFMALKQKEDIADTLRKKPAPRIPSGGSGGGAPSKITVEQFLTMTDEQIAKIPEAELRELHKQMGEN